MDKFRVLATDYYGNAMEQIVDTMEQAIPVSQSWIMQGWNVTIVPIPNSYIDDLTREATDYVVSINPTYH